MTEERIAVVLLGYNVGTQEQLSQVLQLRLRNVIWVPNDTNQDLGLEVIHGGTILLFNFLDTQNSSNVIQRTIFIHNFDRFCISSLEFRSLLRTVWHGRVGQTITVVGLNRRCRRYRSRGWEGGEFPNENICLVKWTIQIIPQGRSQ